MPNYKRTETVVGKLVELPNFTVDEKRYYCEPILVFYKENFILVVNKEGIYDYVNLNIEERIPLDRPFALFEHRLSIDIKQVKEDGDLFNFIQKGCVSVPNIIVRLEAAKEIDLASFIRDDCKQRLYLNYKQCLSVLKNSNLFEITLLKEKESKNE